MAEIPKVITGTSWRSWTFLLWIVEIAKKLQNEMKKSVNNKCDMKESHYYSNWSWIQLKYNYIKIIQIHMFQIKTRGFQCGSLLPPPVWLQKCTWMSSPESPVFLISLSKMCWSVCVHTKIKQSRSCWGHQLLEVGSAGLAPLPAELLAGLLETHCMV